MKDLKYNYKMQSKIIIRGMMVFIILSIVGNISRDYNTWHYMKGLLIVMPVFLISNILSEEYACFREGILFTCRMPVYRQMLKRFLWSWAFSQVLILIAYLSAFFVGLEYNFSRYIALMIISTFLSLLGLTASNISRKSLVGFAIPLAYWGLQMVLGFKFNESIKLFSVIVNVEIITQMVWMNLIVLFILSVIMLIFNIWYVGKGEKIRIPLLKYSAIVLVVAFMGTGICYFIHYSKDTAASKILRDKDTIFVIDSDNSSVYEFVNNRKINYTHLKDFDIKKTDNNIVFITESNSPNLKIIKEKNNFMKKINTNNEGVEVDDISVLNGSAYRAVCLNPENNKQQLVYMESTCWNEKSLELLFNEKRGNFIAVKDDICLAKSYYNVKNISSLSDKIKLRYKNSWLMKKKGDVRVLFRDIPKAGVKIDDIVDIWAITYEELNKRVKEKIDVNTLQMYYRDNGENLHKNAVKVEIRDRRSFEPAKFTREPFVEIIPDSAIEQLIFKNIEDNAIKGAWSDYLKNTIIIQAFGERADKEFLEINYHKDIRNYPKEYIENIENRMKSISNKEDYKISDAYYVAVYMLNSLYNNTEDLSTFIDEIYRTENKINNKELESILSKYCRETKISGLFDIYNKASKVRQSLDWHQRKE
jgi:hypothetical protein